jgi:2-iminobutanoate/2-iminopropanoate deaminase
LPGERERHDWQSENYKVKSERSSGHRAIEGPDIPKPSGPYSPGMGFERLVFVAGQGGGDPVTGAMPDDIEAQTEQCLRNVEAILAAAGSSLQHVLRCGVFLIDMGEFDRMNGVYARMFGNHRPARTTVQAAALPKAGLRVEIDCIAYVP